MLLRLILLIFVSVSFAFAKGDYKIKDIDNTYYLVSSLGEKYKMKYNGKPKLKKIKKLNNLLIVDYYSGEFGTEKLIEVSNRLVINLIKKKVIVDSPYHYSEGKSPVWNIDQKNKTISVKDPNGIDIKKSF